MMKVFFKIFLLILFANFCDAQSTATGQVLDSETNEPLEYVNIGIKDSQMGTVTDHQGKFEIKFHSKKDILIFSYVGYHSESVAITNLTENLLILMRPIPYLIDEIQIVSSHLDKELILGEMNEKERGHSVGFGNAQLGTELGALINIDKETLVKSVNFVLNHAKGDSLLLRINMYDYKDGAIGENILDHNIYVKDKQHTGTYTVDIEEYEIMLNNDVLLSLEWLRDFDESGNKLVTFDTKKSKNLGGTFIRYSKTGEFQKITYKENYKPCFYFVGKQNSN